MKIELKVKLDWHIVEAIENEARTNALHAVGDPDIFVEELVNYAVNSWVARNIPDYYDETNMELRRIETEVLEDLQTGKQPTAADYPDWYGRNNSYQRVDQLRQLVKRIAPPE